MKVEVMRDDKDSKSNWLALTGCAGIGPLIIWLVLLLPSLFVIFGYKAREEDPDSSGLLITNSILVIVYPAIYLSSISLASWMNDNNHKWLGFVAIFPIVYFVSVLFFSFMSIYFTVWIK